MYGKLIVFVLLSEYYCTYPQTVDQAASIMTTAHTPFALWYIPTSAGIAQLYKIIHSIGFTIDRDNHTHYH